MKKVVILVIFEIIVTSLVAQEYVPIADNAEWSVSWMKFKTCGDTVINEKNYLKVYQLWDGQEPFDLSKAYYYCALRNDTLNKRVYVVYPQAYYDGIAYPLEVYEYMPISSHIFLFNATDTTEFLLYDFSLNMGDTVSVYEWSQTGYLLKVKMKRVEEIGLGHPEIHDVIYLNTDSMQALENGDFRKRILMQMNYPYGYHCDYSTVWIEEMGSIHGLTRHFSADLQMADVGYWYLLCYTRGNDFLLNTPFNVNNNCIYNGGAGIKEKEHVSFKLYPNPSSNMIKIESADFSKCKMDIMDVFGRIVYSTIFYNSVEIDVSTFPDNLYFVRVEQENKPSFYEKLIINRLK